MGIKQAIEQINTRTQEVPSNWHAGKGLSDGVTWAEVREWLMTLLKTDCTCGAKNFGPPEEDCPEHGAAWATSVDYPCNCDHGDASGHHVWCDIYRPQGMGQATWEAHLERHPLAPERPTE